MVGAWKKWPKHILPNGGELFFGDLINYHAIAIKSRSENGNGT